MAEYRRFIFAPESVSAFAEIASTPLENLPIRSWNASNPATKFQPAFTMVPRKMFPRYPKAAFPDVFRSARNAPSMRLFMRDSSKSSGRRHLARRQDTS